MKNPLSNFLNFNCILKVKDTLIESDIVRNVYSETNYDTSTDNTKTYMDCGRNELKETMIDAERWQDLKGDKKPYSEYPNGDCPKAGLENAENLEIRGFVQG